MAKAPPSKIRDRIKAFRRVRAGDLAPNPRNWRRHPEAQRKALQGVLEEVGYAGACIAREVRGGKLELIDGHLRQSLDPEQMLPVLVLDVTKAEADKLLATIDPLVGMAEADEEQLADLIRDIEFANADAAELLQSISDEHSQYPEEVVEDHAPAPPDAATTQAGDLWILGTHRLLCGDSASPSDLDRLLDGQKIHLVNTDPPYNVNVEPRSNNAIASGLSSFAGRKHHQQLDLARHPGNAQPTQQKMRPKDRPLANDCVSDGEFDRLVMAWFGNIGRVLLPGRSFYIWGGYANCANYPEAMKRCGLYFAQAIIWVKENPVLTWKDFMGNHEWDFHGANAGGVKGGGQKKGAKSTPKSTPSEESQADPALTYDAAFYGWREGAGHKFFGPANVPDVWTVKKVSPQKMVHLTEKPVELASRAMAYSSRRGENVLDLFGGSGSTLMAAEQTERKAYLMELDTLYCDVIVQRWEAFTGKKAKRVKASK